jgi:hypothetical protein
VTQMELLVQDGIISAYGMFTVTPSTTVIEMLAIRDEGSSDSAPSPHEERDPTPTGTVTDDEQFYEKDSDV